MTDEDEAYQAHVEEVEGMLEDARTDLDTALSALNRARSCVAAAVRRGCGGDCCAYLDQDLFALIDDAARGTRIAHRLARVEISR